MRKAITIHGVNLVCSKERQRLSATVDGELVWFDLSGGLNLEVRGEIFIAVALLEAMFSNLPIVLIGDILISPTLLRRLDELQDIYCCWNADLKKIAIQGGTITASKSNDSIGCFYSGGVDGGYSFCRHKDEVSHLITLAGFDIIDPKQWSSLIKRNKALTKELGLSFIDVNSNFRQFSEKRKISIYFQHGLVLAGIAITLGFKKVYIPTGLTVDDLYPWSCHPLTDPLWSIEHREVVHDGVEMPRSSKVKFLANYPEVLNNLQVCWANIDHNCGTCSKCMRTRASLYFMNMRCATLEPINNTNVFKQITISDKSGLSVVKDLLVLAQHYHCKKEITLFKKTIRRYLIKYHLEELIKLVLGRRLKNIIRNMRGKLWQSYRVTMEGKSEN